MKNGKLVVKPKNIPSINPLNKKVQTSIGFPSELLLFIIAQIQTKICTKAVKDANENTK